MVDFIMWVAIIGTGLCVLVFLSVLALIILMLGNSMKNYILPPPDKAAERMYGQQYHDRIVSKD
jgi:Na+-transporting methylmalonyl-CoA/oxaloacetate decarboxylase gamma subunit